MIIYIYSYIFYSSLDSMIYIYLQLIMMICSSVFSLTRCSVVYCYALNNFLCVSCVLILRTHIVGGHCPCDYTIYSDELMIYYLIWWWVDDLLPYMAMSWLCTTFYGDELMIYYLIWYNYMVTVRQPFVCEV